ncbi:hypothetical protein BCR42DRAFT_427435 [Absidia repens]|uniref:RING-type E3 ubiquitin transferase n=1 Tax=Absidia repens TaxID=90262 RepID=A0A1X2I0S6_9FUNG|nr:hypothetical protein BCR42DRAFT_427435 [Absidia repens]
MLWFYQAGLVILFVKLGGIHALSLFQGTSSKIIQDMVWLYSNSSSLDYTYSEFSPIFYDESIKPLASDTNQINQTGLRGVLYDRGHSCSLTASIINNDALPSPIHNSSNTAVIQKVALIKDGGRCAFRDKIMNAQMDGASACIIYPEQPNSSQPFQTQNENLYNGSVIIPVFYVPNDIGQRLFSQLSGLSTSPRFLSINNNGPLSVNATQVVRVLMLPASSGSPNPWEITLLIMIVFLTVGFISSVCLHTYLWRKNRILQQMIEEGQLPPTLDMLPMGKTILDAAKIDLFPTRTISEKDVHDRENGKTENKNKRHSTVTVSSVNTTGQLSSKGVTLSRKSADIDDNTCVICLDALDVGQKVRQLPCEHEYHCHCIDPWLTSKSGECPLCKFDCVGHVTSPEEQKATEEAHAYYLNTDVNLFHIFMKHIRRRFFVSSSPTPQQ